MRQDAPVLSDLSALRIWGAWREDAVAVKDGVPRTTKVPYGANHRAASSVDPDTWLTRPEAEALLAALRPGAGPGRGLAVFLGRLPGPEGWILAGLDMDRAVGPHGLERWALDAIKACGGYCELSPSGNGCKAFVLVHPSEEAEVRLALGLGASRDGRAFKRRDAGEHPPGFEFYLNRRFFAVTGDDLGLTPPALGVLTAERALRLRGTIETLLGRTIEEPTVALAGAGHNGPPPDASLAVEEALKWRPALARLWTGDLSDMGEDRSRSAVAFRLGLELKQAGVGEAEAREALAAHPLTRDWLAEKGDATGGREWSRLWRHAPASAVGMLPMEAGFSSADPPPSATRRARSARTQQQSAADGEGCDPDDAPVPEDGKPVITIAVPLHETVNEAEKAVQSSGTPVFQRGGMLVRPIQTPAKGTRNRPTVASELEPLTAAKALDVLSCVAHWQKWSVTKESFRKANPPTQIAEVWLSRKGDWLARPVFGIVTVPTLRRDGSLLSRPGYDDATGLYLMPDPDVRLPDEWDSRVPTKADAEAAMTLLEGLLEEFPFAGEADKAVALSAMLTPAVRGAMDVCPMHVFDAHQASSGKTYLVDLACAAVLGRPAPVSTAGQTEEETEKRLGATLLSGTPIGVIDNVNGRLESDLLCQAIERPVLKIRVLGRSEERTVDNSLCLFATGNNIEVVGDLVRRSLTCRLAATVERPETRAFRRRPREEVLADRGRYVAAALTIVRAHMLAGFPGCETMRPLASFDEWGRLVRGAMRWLDRTDPVETVERSYLEDPERREMNLFLRSWAMALGNGDYLVREAVEAVMSAASGGGSMTAVGAFGAIGSGGGGSVGEDRRNAAVALRDSMLRLAGHNGVVNVAKLGRWIVRHKGQITGGWRFVEAHSGERANAWRVERVSPHLQVVGG